MMRCNLSPLLLLAILPAAVFADESDPIPCTQCANCRQAYFYDINFVCNSDGSKEANGASVIPVCNCAKCTCDKGDEDWCEIESKLKSDIASFIAYSQADIVGTTLQNLPDGATLAFEYGANGVAANTWRGYLTGNGCTRATFKTYSCLQFHQAHEFFTVKVNKATADITFLNRVHAALVGGNDVQLKNKVISSVFYFTKLRAFLQHLMLLLAKGSAYGPGHQCISNTMCPTKYPLCKTTDCKCHECQAENDCTSKYKNKHLCVTNKAGLMVCGDPHVKQSVKGSDRWFCYDFVGVPGERYAFLNDGDFHISTTFINAKDGENRVDFVSDLDVDYSGVNIHFSPSSVVIKEPGQEPRNVKWNIGTVSVPHGYINMTRKRADFILNEGETKINVIRRGFAKKHPFLNFGLTQSKHIGDAAGGIMGSISNTVEFSPNVAGDGGIIEWLGNRVPVHEDSKYCLKVDKTFTTKFNGLLEKFRISKDDEAVLEVTNDDESVVEVTNDDEDEAFSARANNDEDKPEDETFSARAYNDEDEPFVSTATSDDGADVDALTDRIMRLVSNKLKQEIPKLRQKL
ncbi:unnamed protein product [Owenia fusiformis]|uniref:Uncharacterized protein n=1 Tax=Owenia fusiformis TaxID=6347 RepID=A0A8J1UKC5_OWEFU|nr:unnamed protein product [Owenia fusiformis]